MDYSRLTDAELAQRWAEERVIVGFMLQLGFGRRAKQASDEIALIQSEMLKRQDEYERNRSGAV